MNNIKKNDVVMVITGKDKGKSGKVLSVANDKVLIEKINIAKRHTKPSRNFQGGIVDKVAPVHISNVSLICSTCKKFTKVVKSTVIEGKRIRTCKKCGEPIDKI